MSQQPDNSAGAPARSGTYFGAVPCFFICATIAFIAWLYVSPKPEPAPRLWLPVVIETNGHRAILGETRQMEFWTPSAKTKDFLQKENGTINDKEKWQIITNDDVLVRFGSVLHSNHDVFGYHRVEVWGQGRTTYKPGWWWTMTVTTNYSVMDLAHAYETFWKSPQSVLINVIDNRGSIEN